MRPLTLTEVFGERKFVVIGVVHLPPLPGSPLYEGDFSHIVDRAVSDARALEEGGVDGLIVENYCDVPFLPRVTDPETIAAMAVVVREVVREVSIPVGVSFLRNSAVEAIAVSYVAGARFVRVNAWVEPIVCESGLIQPAAPHVLRYMRRLGARLAVLADVHVKHAAPLVERPLEEVVREAFERGMASAVIITGRRTGEPPSEEDLRRAKKSARGPVLIGSGLSPDTLHLVELADGAIVGTYFKRGGVTTNPVDVERVRRLISLIRERVGERIARA